MSCKKDLECIYQFLVYPQRLLNFTHKIFGYNRISLDREDFIDQVIIDFDMTKKTVLEFIKLWNNSPKYCCLPNSVRKGKCTVYPSQCNESGVQTTERLRNLTLDELLDIKKKNNIIPNYAECLVNKHCPRRGNKKSWRDSEKDACIDYKCGFIKKPNWNKPKNRKNNIFSKK